LREKKDEYLILFYRTNAFCLHLIEQDLCTEISSIQEVDRTNPNLHIVSLSFHGMFEVYQ